MTTPRFKPDDKIKRDGEAVAFTVQAVGPTKYFITNDSGTVEDTFIISDIDEWYTKMPTPIHKTGVCIGLHLALGGALSWCDVGFERSAGTLTLHDDNTITFTPKEQS